METLLHTGDARSHGKINLKQMLRPLYWSQELPTSTQPLRTCTGNRADDFDLMDPALSLLSWKEENAFPSISAPLSGELMAMTTFAVLPSFFCLGIACLAILACYHYGGK